METICKKALVEGKVQGVFFRESTREQALKHGVTGHAKNLPDGRVEVVMCGNRQALKSLSEWLWKGSPDARVTHVEIEDLDTHAPDTFATG